MRQTLWYMLLGVSLSACKSASPSKLSDAPFENNPSSSSISFNVPSCIKSAGCTDADKQQAAEDSDFEAQVLRIIDGAQNSIKFSMYTFSNKNIYLALARAAHRGVQIIGILDDGLFAGFETLCDFKGCRFEKASTLITTTSKAIADLEAIPPTDERTRIRNVAKIGGLKKELENLMTIDRLLADNRFINGSILERINMLEEGEFRANGFSRPMKLAIAFYNSGDVVHTIRYAPGRSRIVHNKLVIADDTWLMTGSGNWSSTGLTINLENQFVSRDPKIVRAFVCMMNIFANPNAPFHQQATQCQTDQVAFSPTLKGSSGVNQIQSMIYESIDRATSQIDISMHHLTLDTVYEKLAQALKRGVKVRLLFDDDDCNGGDPTSEEKLTSLEQEGVEIRYVPTACSLFQLSHNKFGIFDQSLVVNGSGNWSEAGTGRNYENFIRIQDPNLVLSFNDFFREAWQIAKTQDQCRCDRSSDMCRSQYCLDRSF